MQTAISRFLQYLLVERNASPLTIKSYREDLEALAAYLAEASGGRRPTPGTSRRSTSRLRFQPARRRSSPRRRSPAAWRRCGVSFVSDSAKAGPNPTRPSRWKPRKSRSLPHFLSVGGIRPIAGTPPADKPLGLRDRALLETMYSAGLRVSELVGLNDSDVDLTHGVVRVRGKGRRERLSPIGSYAAKAL